ncbi:hypothetical protein ACOMHN_007773 [Nucella lapillus]
MGKMLSLTIVLFFLLAGAWVTRGDDDNDDDDNSGNAACCAPNKWEGKQLTSFVRIGFGMSDGFYSQMKVSYDAENEREAYMVNKTDTYGNQEQYKFLAFYKKSIAYRLDIKTGSCKAQALGAFQKRCIPEESMVLDPEGTLGIGSNKMTARRVFYTTKNSESGTTYGVAMLVDKCVPVFETRQNSLYGTLSATSHTFEDMEEGIESEDVFDLPDACNSLGSRKRSDAKQSVPLKSVGRARIKKWMDRKTLESVRKKHRLFRRWQQTQEIGDYTAYLKARNKASRECRKAKRNLEATVAAEAKNNPKVFWSYVKSKTTTRSGIGDLKKENGSKTTSDQEKAELLNNFFHSVFTHEDDGPLPDPPTAEYSTTLEDFEISEEKVLKLLQTLKIHKATGPDGINPLVLSKAADILAHPVTILFRKSLEDGQVPQDWRTATVSPIFKKGSRLQPCNYRPVSLTCILCKVMEKLIRENVIKHLDENVLISRQQHGFVQGRSCVTQLLDVMDAWTEILDAGGSVDIIYMDFMKAFDSVPHRRLLMKLAAYGIQGKVLDWTRAFLTDRQQSVVVNGAKSQTAPVTSGIPQGSVVGPMLFVVYINDLPNICVSEVKLFADDTKLYTRSDIPGATTALQADLDKLQQWSQDWLLRFHPQKCSVMKLGSKKSEVEYTMQDATQGTTVLEEHEHEKDLGVHVDNKLCFKEHVAKSTAKANKIVGIIRRTFDYLSNDLFAQLYKSLVRPILEYGHSVWQPHHKTLCSEVEDVQRRATKLLAPLRDKPYPERLMILGLPTLEHRRNRGDMIDLYKYMYGIYDSDRPKFEITKNRATRGNSLRIIKKHCRLDVRSGTFSQRVVNTWNDLPEFVVRAPSMNSFKGRLDAHWKNLASVHTPTCQS